MKIKRDLLNKILATIATYMLEHVERYDPEAIIKILKQAGIEIEEESKFDWDKLNKKVDNFWNNLTQKEFDDLWDELKLSEYYKDDNKFERVKKKALDEIKKETEFETQGIEENYSNLYFKDQSLYRICVVHDKGKTTFYVNGKKIDDLNKYFDIKENKEEDYLALAENDYTYIDMVYENNAHVDRKLVDSMHNNYAKAIKQEIELRKDADAAVKEYCDDYNELKEKYDKSENMKKGKISCKNCKHFEPPLESCMGGAFKEYCKLIGWLNSANWKEIKNGHCGNFEKKAFWGFLKRI